MASPIKPPIGADEWEFTNEEDDWEFADSGPEPSAPVKPTTPTPTPTPQEEPSWWDKFFTAPEFVRRPAERFAQAITDPNLKTKIAGYLPEGLGGVSAEQLAAYGTGFIGGATTGAAEQLSPGNIALAAVGGGEATAIKSATKLAQLGKVNEARKMIQVARGLEVPTRAAGAVTAYRGLTTIADPEATLGQRLGAIPQIAGGVLGARSRAYGVGRAIEEQPTRLAPEATDIPMGRQGDIFAREGDILGEQPLVPRRLPSAAPEGPLDPRITSIRPETALEEIPGVGLAGPEVTGQPMSETTRKMVEDLEILAGRGAGKDPEIEAAREAAKAQIDEELGITREEKTSMRGAAPTVQKPTTVIVKKDVPETMKMLLERGYEFVGTTPEGHPRMQLVPTDEPLFDVVKGKFGREERPEDRLYKPGQLIRQKSTGQVGRVTVTPEELRGMTFDEINEYKNRIMTQIPEGMWNAKLRESDIRMIREIHDEIDRRQQTGYGTIRKFQQEEGLGIEPVEKQWEIARKEAEILGINHTIYDNLDELQWDITRKAAQETVRTGKNPFAPEGEEGPQFARNAKGELVIGQDIRRSAGELTTGYSASLQSIMMREAMQNAIDAVKAQGSKGGIKVRTTKDGFEISDTGPGMTLQQLETVFTDLHSSGKITETGATGGKGVGKASYMLGGEYFEAETISVENGKKVKYTIKGTPEQLMSGFKETREEMPKDTPTGTKIRTKLTAKQAENYSAINAMLHNITEYSRGISPKIMGSLYNEGEIFTPTGKEYFTEQKWREPGREILTDEPIPNGTMSLEIPTTTKSQPRTSITLRILNNGMYQYTDWNYFLGEETPNMPGELIVNIKPTAEEGTEEYPFPVQRESLKDVVDKEVKKIITDKLVNPVKHARRSKLKEIYENLQYVPVPSSSGRKTIIFDPGKRLTPKESAALATNPVIRELVQTYDAFINIALEKLSDQFPAWGKKLEGVGIVLDPNMHGVHIPNPTASPDNPKSIILINPFEYHGLNPSTTALDTVVTILHEMAHIGAEAPATMTEMPPQELGDPRVGHFLQTYIKETMAHGGGDLGHGVGFIKRLGEIYATVGPGRALQAADKIESAISTNIGGFSPEYEKLLSLYKESRRRDPTQEDFLSGTGIKQTTSTGGAGNIPGTPGGPGGRTTLPTKIVLRKDTKAIRKAWADLGYMPTGESTPQGLPIWEKPKVTEGSALEEAYNLPRGMMSVDLPFLTSAAMRQGAPMILLNTKGWMKAWVDSVRAYGAQHAYDSVMNEISRHPYFRRRDMGGGITKESIAAELGLELTEVGSFTKREETIKSKWAEKIPGYGKLIAASNRGYTAFLNSLRASSFIRFADQAKLDSRSLLGTGIPGRDVEKDIVFGKELTEAVNTLTGRGKLKIDLPYTEKKINLERATGVLTNFFFSPKLMFSRFKMFNPSTYINADPFVRKLWVKGFLGAMSTWWTIASLAEMLGAEVSKDPNNADFGKIKVGNTRFDPGAGFQQNLVLASRIRPEWLKMPIELPTPPYGEMVQDPGGGKTVSSTTGEEHALGEFGYPDAGDLVLQYFANKRHPMAAYIMDLANAMLSPKNTRPFPIGDKTLQLAAPMLSSDIYGVYQENPYLLGPYLFGSSIGFGGQHYESGKPEPSFTPMLGLEEYDIYLGER